MVRGEILRLLKTHVSTDWSINLPLLLSGETLLHRIGAVFQGIGLLFHGETHCIFTGDWDDLLI